MVFNAGVVAGGYMMLKTGDWTLSSVDKYERLVSSEGLSRWPIRIMYLCLPLGIAIAFAAVLAS
jgi:hypothetical protein